MNFLQIAGRDIKTIFKNRIIRVSVVAIIIVPLLYSLLYLDAFWDPYSKLENMPVAVVNLDKGTEVDGEKVNYGDGVVDNLRNSTEVGWKFVSEEEATKGLEGNDYYAIFEITDDFSEKVVSAKEGTPEMAGLKFICNEKKNFLAAQVSTKIQSALKEKIVSTITNNYVKVAFDNLYTVKDGMTEAADGSEKINDGLNTLNGKVPELVDGVNQLSDGSGKLYDGQVTLKKGINDLYNGVGGQLQPGVKELDLGLAKLNAGVPALTTGINDLYDGSKILAAGTTSAKSGSQELAIGTTAAKGGSQQLAIGTTDAKDGSRELADGTQKLYVGYSTKIYPSIVQLSDGAKALNYSLTNGKDSIGKLQIASSQLKDTSDKIKAGSSAVKNGYANVEAGVNQLITGVNYSKQTMEGVSADLAEALSAPDDGTKDAKITEALIKLKNYQDANVGTGAKIQGLQSGMSSLDDGITQFDGFVSQYTTGVKGFADGTTTLINNVGQVQTGVSQINGGLGLLQTSLDNEFGPGLNKANNGALSLNDGLIKINNGALSLNDGLTKINNGALSLNDGLGAINNGSIKINDGLTTMKGKAPELSEGVPKLAAGSNKLLNGVNGLYDGTSKLASGSNELVDGQGQLKDGINKLQLKVPDLKDGVSKLYNGSSELATKLSEGATKLDNGLVNTSGDMADFVSKPVEMKIEPINAVPNYGTGFSPYFMNLSLWIGAIMMFFVISAKTDEYEGVSRVHKALGKYLSFAFIGVLQAVLVGIAVLWLGLRPENIPVYFAILIFCSLVFVAIVQFLISIFGDAGRLLSIIYLILQLTACAGTFPLELVPGFFKVLNPFMPFTYAVEALREICSATVINYGIIGKDAVILGVFFVLFLGGSIVLKHVGDKIQNIMEGKKEEAFKSE